LVEDASRLQLILADIEHSNGERSVQQGEPNNGLDNREALGGDPSSDQNPD